MMSDELRSDARCEFSAQMKSKKEKLMSRPIPDNFRDLFKKRTHASLSTLMPDGSPQVTNVWCDVDGDLLVINTVKGRQKEKNIRRDPRVAVTITDPDNAYRYLGIRGRVVEITEKDAEAHMNELTKRYLGVDKYPHNQPGDVRVKCKIQIDRILVNDFPHADYLRT
jgi:PPOX class probable F420-dependent enzyme